MLPLNSAESFQPRVVAELAPLRNGVEDPQPLAGADVVAAHHALRVAHRPRRRARPVGGADDDDVADDERRGVEPELGGVEIDVLIGFELQIDGAVASERRESAHPVFASSASIR